VSGLLRRNRLTSTKGGETRRMADSQVKGVLSICVIVPTMTGDFPSKVEGNGRSDRREQNKRRNKKRIENCTQRTLLNRST